MNEQVVTDSVNALCLEIGVRPIKNGRIVLHFDGDGLLQDVEMNVKRKVRRAPRSATGAPPRVGG